MYLTYKKIQKLDLLFLVCLLSICLIANLTLRGEAITSALGLECALAFAWCSAALLWIGATRWFSKSNAAALSNNGVAALPVSLTSWQLAYLLLYTVLAFFIPLRQNFWHGYDDPIVCWYGSHPSFISAFDHDMNRPFAFAQSYLVNLLTPNSIDGYMWLAIGTHLLWGCFIYLILQEFFPGAVMLSLVAALLLIANPADPMRYMMIVLPGYYFTICTLLGSVWLYLRSYRIGSRFQLLLSCLLLNYSMLAACEAGYVVAAVIPFLLLVAASRQPTRRFSWTWIFAWFGTLSAPALRLIIFLANNHNAYQLSASGGKPLTLARLLNGLCVHTQPIANYFDTVGIVHHWRYGLLLTAAVGLAFLLLWRRSSADKAQSLRLQYFAGMLISAILMLLGVAAFLNFGSPIRTQFYSAPAQAALLAIAIELSSTFIAETFRKIFRLSAAALLVVLASTGSMQYQHITSANINYGNVSKVFEQIHKLAPDFTPDTVVLLVLQDRTPTTLGANYAFQCLINQSLGVNGFMVNFEDPIERNFVFRRNDAAVFNHGKEADSVPRSLSPFPGVYPCDYSRVVAFLLSSDGHVTLMRELPTILTGANANTSAYTPLTRINTNKIVSKKLPYISHSAWMPNFHYPQGIVVGDSPIILGKQWGTRQKFGDDDCHLVQKSAEIGFSDAAKLYKHGELVIDIAPNPFSNGKPMTVTLREKYRGILDRKIITKREIISLKTSKVTPSTVLTLETNAPDLKLPDGKSFWQYRVQSIGYKDATLN